MKKLLTIVALMLSIGTTHAQTDTITIPVTDSAATTIEESFSYPPINKILQDSFEYVGGIYPLLTISPNNGGRDVMVTTIYGDTTILHDINTIVYEPLYSTVVFTAYHPKPEKPGTDRKYWIKRQGKELVTKEITRLNGKYADIKRGVYWNK